MRHGSILKRTLLAGLCLLLIGIAALQPATSSRTRTTRATAARAPSTTATQPTTPAPKPPGPGYADDRRDVREGIRPSPRQSAPRRAAADALTSAAAMVPQSEPLPARLHISRVQLITVNGARSSWTAQFAVIDRPPSPAARPTAPHAARDTAMTFTTSYLAYTYGHASIEQLRGVTTGLRARLTAHPPRVPPTVRTLDPRIASLALTPDGKGWLASANVTDGQNTYQVISILRRVHASWRVMALRSAG